MDLHEEAGEQALANVGIVILALEVRRLEFQLLARHHTQQLRAHGVCGLHATMIKEVVVAPSGRLLVILVRVVRVEQRQMVPVRVLEARFGLISRLGGFLGAQIWVGRVEHCDDGEDLV